MSEEEDKDWEAFGRPMQASDFRAWRERRGYTEREACKALGMSRGFLRTCEREGAPLYVAYACAAELLGLPPFKVPFHYRRALLENLDD